MVNSRYTTVFDRFVTHKVNANALPTDDWADLLRDNVMPTAPPGLGQVHLGGGATAAEANELAAAVAMKKFAARNGVGAAS